MIEGPNTLKSGSTRPDNVAVKLSRTFAAVNVYDAVALIPASLLLKATASPIDDLDN